MQSHVMSPAQKIKPDFEAHTGCMQPHLMRNFQFSGFLIFAQGRNEEIQNIRHLEIHFLTCLYVGGWGGGVFWKMTVHHPCRLPVGGINSEPILSDTR